MDAYSLLEKTRAIRLKVMPELYQQAAAIGIDYYPNPCLVKTLMGRLFSLNLVKKPKISLLSARPVKVKAGSARGYAVRRAG